MSYSCGLCGKGHDDCTCSYLDRNSDDIVSLLQQILEELQKMNKGEK